MARYGTYVDDSSVFVGSQEGRVRVGTVDDIVAAVGGPAWTIRYTDAEKDRHPSMDTSDEGLTVDVVDVMQAMTHGERFVQTLAAHPVDAPTEDGMAPRLGLFVGKLLENLENGVV